jgi:integrase
MSRRPGIPSYRLHKQSGQAIVTLTDAAGNRHDVLLGKHDTPESRAEYLRVVTEWEAAGRCLPVAGIGVADLTVNELILAYWKFAEGYYQKNGKPSTQLDRIRHSLRPVRELYGHTLASQFGPKALKAVRLRMMDLPCGHCQGKGSFPPPTRLNRRSGRQSLICARCNGSGRYGWARRLVNSAIGCVKRMFKWGVAEEIIPASVYHGLLAVEGLRKGRCTARESKPVEPVAPEHVEAVLPFLTPPVRVMVELQQLTGMRPGEVVLLRPCDVDRTQPTWIYRPESHKTEHHGRIRVIFLGPRTQQVLRPFLERHPGTYCFSPREAMAAFRERQRHARKTRVQPSQQSRKKRSPRRQPGERYSVDTYGNAVERACLAADRQAHALNPSIPTEQVVIPCWRPHQLRHTAATEVRRRFGLEAAQVVLGHRHANVSEIYAERDLTLAARVAAEMG